jgi:hypothetical protein
MVRGAIALGTGIAVVLAAAFSAAAAIGAVPAGATPACVALGSGAQVHYAMTWNPKAPPGHVAAVTQVIVGNLSAGCDGATARLVISGNPSGNPAQAASEVLATADSGLDPCSQHLLAKPVLVARGAIALSLCPSGGPAGYVPLQPLTQLTLYVNAVPVAVASGQGQGTTGPNSPARPTKGGLAFTGAAVSLTAFVGVIAILAGWPLVRAVGRRRRSPRPSAGRPSGM